MTNTVLGHTLEQDPLRRDKKCNHFDKVSLVYLNYKIRLSAR